MSSVECADYLKNKMFNRILIVYSEKITGKHLETVEKVRNLIPNSSVVKASELNESYFSDLDLIITIGGDGTFIRAAHFIKEAFILGINSEPENSEGALKSLKENEIEKLKEILNGKYSILERDRMQISIDGKSISYPILNEVYFGAEHQFHTSRYVLEFNGEKEEQRSSGVLISTGSGSTAWYKSAGGTPFQADSKKLKFLVREPYSGKIFKPKIMHGEIHENQKIKIISKKHAEQIFAIDSNLIFPFNFNSIAEVSISKFPLKVLEVDK